MQPARRQAEGETSCFEPDVVELRPLLHSDREAIRRWMRDPNLIRFTVLVPGPQYAPVEPYSSDDADRYLSVLVDDPRRRTLAICWNRRHVGNVGLREIDFEASSAECFVELGEPDARGRGLAKKALRRLFAYAFEELRLSRVRLGVFEFNQNAIGLYRSLGFKPTGSYGRHWADGRYWVVHAMELGREAWMASLTVQEAVSTTSH